MCDGTAYTLQMCFKNSVLINSKGISHLSDKDYPAAMHFGDTSRVSAVRFISVKEIALLKNKYSRHIITVAGGVINPHSASPLAWTLFIICKT